MLMMDNKTRDALLNFLLEFITDKRKALFDKVLNDRTRYISVVLEDIYQPHNASAVLRSCDLTGIQDVHIIENINKYDVNPDVALGSSKWLNLIHHKGRKNNTAQALKKLKAQGYRIIVTTPHKNNQTLENISLDGKMALVFGTELTGVSQEAIENADEFLKIPMFGFTESYNISVSAALILYNLTMRLRKSEFKWQLSAEEKAEIKLEWVRRSIRRSEILEKEFLKANR